MTGLYPRAVLGAVLIVACGEDPGAPAPRDVRPPDVMLSASAVFVIVNASSITLTVQATDSGGVVTGVDFLRLVGGQTVVLGSDATAPYELVYPPGGFGVADSGTHAFMARATDSAGNVGHTTGPTYVTVAIDVTPPVLTLTSDGTQLTTPGRLGFLAGANEGVTSLELYDGPAKVGESTSGLFEVTFGRTDNGLHSFTATGRDFAGNVDTSPALEIPVDIRWAWIDPLADVGGTAVAVDSSGGVYLAGATSDGAVGGSSDFALVKVDAAGALQWVRRFGDANVETGTGVAVDPAGAVYIAGELYIYGATPDQECLLVKYTSAGDTVWSRRIGTPFTESGCRVAVDAAGAVYLAGSTWGVIAPDSNQVRQDAFLVKLTTTGDTVWKRQFGSVPGSSFGDDYVTGVAVDPSGAVYVGGYTNGKMGGNANAGFLDFFVLKYGADGVPLWARQLGTPQDDEALGVAGDPSGGVYIAGWNRGGFDGAPTTPLTDAALARYDAAGNLLWVRQLASLDFDYGTAVAADTGAVYLVGETHGFLGGNPPQGFSDLFLATYGRDGTLRRVGALGSPGLDSGWGVTTPGDGSVFVAGFYQSLGTGPQSGGVVARHQEPPP